jgi:sterol-4alpha-carboxylate 3-dehydrogenase (decarboxylating)
MLTAAIRPAGIIGEGDVQLIPQMLKAYERGQTGFQLGSNDNMFDFTYVQNAAHGHILAAKALLEAYANLKAGKPINEKVKVDGEAFFITNDSPIYFWDFPRAVWKTAGDTTALNVFTIPKDVGLAIGAAMEWIFWALGKKATLTRKEVKYSCMTRYYNIGKAKERLGYAPIVSLQVGIERAVKWYSEQKTKEGEKKAQ